jgi:hypothetical protein
MDLLGKARRLESKLARTFDTAAQQWTKSGPRGPLEVLHAIVEAVGERLEPAGRGTHVFPFNRMKVSILAPSREARARFSALFEAAPTLEERISKRLQDAGCGAVSPQIKVVYVDRAAPEWTKTDVHLEFDRVAADAPRAQPSEPEMLKITVLRGAAERPSYTFGARCINLGRCAEVRDHRNRLLRTNQVVFLESADGPNSGVSRRHAHIDYVSEAGQYRICDDGSAHGTGVVRNGKTLSVPPGPRGIRLRSGDELLLGEARLRVRIDT